MRLCQMGLVETVSGSAVGPRAGERKQQGVPQLCPGWAVQGQRWVPGSAVAWGPSCGAVDLLIRAQD